MNNYDLNMNLEELHQKLQKHLDSQESNWKSLIYAQKKGFYQGFEEIKIEGWRPTEKRFRDYKIEKYLSKDKSVLDIGSNCGFFTLYASRYVKEIEGVEINPYLVAISNDVKEYLKINNAKFNAISFEDFSTDKKYDVIVSFANDSTIDGNTKFNFYQYIEKVCNLLHEKGMLIFECQAADMVPQSRFLPKLNHLKEKFVILENRLVKSEYPVNVPTRFFLVCRKM